MSSDMQTLEADYLVVGSGAMGMAFTDVLVTDSQATTVMVDRYSRPGGHWNDAYPFVRLHSASAYYGVSSAPLGENTLERDGLNRGYHEQASAAEICSYYDRVMQRQFLPSGRVRYFPGCNYEGDGVFTSMVSGRKHRVVARKIVDATFTGTSIPARSVPRYLVANGMQCVAPNSLPHIRNADRFVVIGAGKTAMDVCIWLLQHDVYPGCITWIMPRDSWLLDREHVEPRAVFFKQRMGALLAQLEAIDQARSVPHLFELLANKGQLLRVDERIVPTRYRCATVSQAELALLREVTNVVRMGHVQRIETDRIILDRGEVPTSRGTVHIDCTASGILSREPVPVFSRDRITLQPIRTCQQCFSSALIAHVELHESQEEEKNALCKPIALPSRDEDWLTMFIANVRNQARWSATPHVREWIGRSRLDLNFGCLAGMGAQERALVDAFRAGAWPAAQKLEALLTAGSTASARTGIEARIEKDSSAAVAS